MNDLVGQRFGRLVVVREGEKYISPSGKSQSKRWICQCDCGGIALCQTGNLIHGRAQSCGCLQKELARECRRNSVSTNAIDITGQKFGRLTALYKVRSEQNNGVIWKCRCECGNEIEVSTKSLRSGNTKSCGCYHKDQTSKATMMHGKSHKSRLYGVWVGMRQRCMDKNHISYKNYGGRGISVCDKWDDFEVFEKWAMDNGYDENAEYGKCTLDRIDVNGNYCPENCRWVDFKTQAKNKRNSVA